MILIDKRMSLFEACTDYLAEVVLAALMDGDERMCSANDTDFVIAVNTELEDA